MAAVIPNLPEFASVVDDSPAFHQSLKYWTIKSGKIGSTIHDIASCLKDYHDTGSKHNESGNALSEIINQSSHVFKDDDLLEEPFAKFADALNRIECYRSMLLTQTQMLGVEPMMNMATDMEKTKKCQHRVTKLSDTMHIAWERFAALPHESNLTDHQLLDKHAHNMLTLRQKYQLLLAEYIENIRDVNTSKKVGLLQRVLEHMFAEFSYFNYCAQILKDLEPYMTELFETLQKKQRDYEQLALLDDSYKRETELKIDVQAQSYRKLFPEGENTTPSHNTSHFLNKVGGFISGVRRSNNAVSPTSKKFEPDWEVIDDKAEDESSQFYIPLKKDTYQEDVATPEETSKSTNDAVDDINNGLEDTDLNNGVENADASPVSDINEIDGLFSNNKVAPIEVPSRLERFSSISENVSKRGYLRIKKRGMHKSKFPLLYFILDKGFGELLSQGQDQKEPKLFAKLQLSNVKPCNPSETDRNYCFILTTSESEFILQASNSQEYEDWMNMIQDGIMAALDGCPTERNRSTVHGNSLKGFIGSPHKPRKSCDNVAARIKNVAGNKFCADCDCPTPGWASSNIGVVICIECSGIHRGLGVQISKIKSLSLDKWDIQLVEVMESLGNTKVNKILEANLNVPKITRTSSKTERLEYIVAKYVHKSFCVPAVEDFADFASQQPNGGDSCEDNVLSDSIDEEFKEHPLDTGSVMCLVKDCQDSTHALPPSLS